MIRKITYLFFLSPLCLFGSGVSDTNEWYSLRSQIAQDIEDAQRRLNGAQTEVDYLDGIALSLNSTDPATAARIRSISLVSSEQISNARAELDFAQRNLLDLVPPDGGECLEVLSNILQVVTYIHAGDMSAVSNLLVNTYDLINTFAPDVAIVYHELANGIANAWSQTKDILDWFSEFYSFYDEFIHLAYERIERPDSSMFNQLNEVWNRAYLNLTNYVLRPLPTTMSDLIYPITRSVIEEDIKLSNEGMISAWNLAANQAQYLCSVEMLKTLQAISNNYSSVTNDQVGWITNYLGTIQAPFYKLFNNTTYRILYGENDFFHATNFQVITNTLNVMSSYPNVQLRSVRSRYENYRKLFSNVWDRIELQLMTMNGLIYYPTTISGIDAETQMGLEEMKDQENAERQLSYSTNAILQFVEEIGINSNRLSQIWDKSKEVLSAFQLDRPNGQGYFEFAPASTFGDQSFDHVYVSYNIGFLEDVKSICHDLFKWLWYFVGAICIVKAVIVTFVSAVKAISHLVLIVSTLLS